MRKITEVKKFQMPIEINREGGYFLARCPIWDDCYAQGESIDEATSEIIAVASSLIELYQEEGFDIPLEEVKEKSSFLTEKITFDIPVFATA